MDKTLKEFFNRGDKRSKNVAGSKHGIKKGYFYMRTTACLYADGNKLMIKRRDLSKIAREIF